MIFKRNVWTVFYSVLYLIVFGLGFYEIFQLAVNASSIPVLYLGLFVAGILSYLVLAYWIRRKRWLDFLQENRLILWIIELCLLVICTGAVYYFNSGQETIRGLLALVMLTLIYGCARLLAGRIGGMGALVMGFFFVISLTQYSFDRQQYLDVICFLVPYFCFLFVTKVVCRIFYRNNFKLLFSYGVLAVVFAVFISLNVMVSALLLGCMCSLLFGTTIKEDGSIMNDGKIAMMFVLLFTAIMLIVIKVFEPALCTLPGTAPDSQYNEIWNMEGLTDYLISKYTRAVRFVYRPFQTTLYPLVMVFLGWLSGFRCIRKKYSSIGPFCLTYLFLLVYYMIFNEIGTHFYYMTYFLPIFAAYGLNSTLVAAEDMQESKINVKPGSEKPVETKSIQENSGDDKTMRRFRASGRKKEKSESAIPEWSLMPGNEDLVKESQEKNEETVSAEAGDTLIPDSDLPTALEEEAEPKQTESFSFDYSNFDSDDNNTVLGGNLSAASQEQDAFLQEESSIPSLMSDEGMMEFESAQEEVSESVTPAEDEQLGSFLDRLDISENIRRMNESAREDMADVIERDDMTNDLSEAIPAEEFHFETVEPEEPEDLVLEEEPEEMETPALEDMPEEMETPVLEDMPEEMEMPVLEDMPEEMETPVLEDVPEEMETPVFADMSEEAEEPALEEAPEEVETPVLEDEDDSDSLLGDSLFSHSFEDSAAESLFEAEFDEAPEDSSIQGELPDSVKDAEDYLDGIEADNETDFGEEAAPEEPEEQIQLEPVTEKLILDSVMDDSMTVGNSDFEDVIQDVEDVDPKSKRRKSAKKKSAKYEKPSFKMDPVTKPLTGSDKVREYEKVPTISELEKKWREINGVGGDDQLEELMARRKSQMQSAEETNHTFMDFSMKQDEQKPAEEVESETTEAVSQEPQALHLESVESVDFDSDLIPEEDFLSFEEDSVSAEPAAEEAPEPEEKLDFEEPVPEEVSEPEEELTFEEPVPEEVSEPEEELTFEEPVLEEVSEPEEELTFEEPVQEEVSEPEEELTFEEPVQEEVSEPEEELTFEEPVQEEVSEPEEELTFEEPVLEEASEPEEELTFEEPVPEEVPEPELETAITIETAQEDVFSAVEDDLFEEEQPVINLDKQVKGAGYESACEEQVSDTQEVVRTICDEKRVYYRVTIK